MFDDLTPISGEERYVDFDEETQLYCHFGTESGFAYATFACAQDATEALSCG